MVIFIYVEEIRSNDEFKEVLTKFLGNMTAPNYKLILANMIYKLKTFDCRSFLGDMSDQSLLYPVVFNFLSFQQC